MRRRRATLRPMDLDQLDRILARVCDIIDQQAGDWDATEATLRREFTGDELDNALTYATTCLIVYAEPDGPEFIRGMRDRRRRLVPALPAGAPGRGFLRRRPA
jgi:hypothetical protein